MPLQILRADITTIDADAVVNPTNRGMIGFSGADLAIHKVAGPELEECCKKLAPIERGKVIVTKGFHMPCKYIIHTCGPVWTGGDDRETEMLEQCYKLCLNTAIELQCESIALPLISSGAYGFPKNIVLSLAVKTITEFLLDHELNVLLCVFDKTSYELSQRLISSVKAYIDDNYVFENSEHLDGEYNSFIRPDSRVILKEEFCKPNVIDSCVLFETQEPVGNTDKLRDIILKADKSFAEMLFDLIDKKGFTDAECYNKANVSRKTFSKIRCDKTYRPSKETVIAFALALELSLEETNAFLSTAGFALSHYYKSDLIIEYFIMNNCYDLNKINQTLFEFDQKCLGCLE